MAGCGVDDPNSRFIGSYNTTLTLSGQGSLVITDAVSISDGATTDLILNSQNAGAIKVDVRGASSFAIPQQQILLNANGQAFSVTIQGQGTVVDGIFNCTGTVSDASGSLAFTWAGQRL
ncbi:MAG: hypothetical protein KF773_40210 [Deltaproteobacteria bacterium]|nr:hypothetical protein [Deltaproteobacteria bacterium]MCW5804358.1 hypothetical protein [Deltaproteobacteria bacterium]